MNETIQIAVRSLVTHVLNRGDLNYGFWGTSRNTAAVRAHQKIQRSRPEGYQAEVSVSHEVKADDLTLVVSGRIDGVFNPIPDKPASEAAGERPCIEEIKTTTGDLNRYKSDEDPLHWGQVKVYAYIYGHRHGLDDIDVQMTYYHLDTGRQLVLKHTFSVADLESFFSSLIEQYLAWAGALVSWRHHRDESIQELAFPYPDYRPGQRIMAVNTYNAIRQSRQLLVQAPTGIGKTMAVLFPALKCLEQGIVAKVFYLTARTTTRTVAEKALDILRERGLQLKSLTLTAKDKTCFEADAACNGEECPYAKGFYDRLQGAISALFSRHDAFDRKTVESAARKHRVCPFEISLELSKWVDVIICDYNYAFDPRVFLRRFFQEDPEPYVFLIDEAHNLVDRARDMFSSEIQKQPFLDLRKSVKKPLPRLYKTLGRINRCLVGYRKACEASGGTISDHAAPEELASLLHDFLFKAEDWLTRNKSAPFRDELLDLYFSVSGFVKIHEQFDDSYVTCMERSRNNLRIKLLCVNPSEHLEHALARCISAIFFSATLTPADYFHHLLGCSKTAGRLTLTSPFPSENLCLLAADDISTRYRHRQESLPAVANAISAVVSQKMGNYLLFFPSYAYLQTVHDTLVSRLTDTDILVQTPGMSETDRDNFLERFACSGQRSLLGFVVMGGIFGEGIDLVGDSLSGAVVVGVGLPAISFENELIREYFSRVCGQGFEYAYVYPGINRVLQAVGRVIRTETDRGIVLLVDERFGTPQYKHLLPEHWRPDYMENDRQIHTTVSRFWEHEKT